MSDIVETEAPDPRMLTKTIMLRGERDRRLRETDHWAFQDTPNMTQEQIDYRQALRDITNTYTSINDVVWPTKPS
jgi:hypothetical protein